MVNGERGAQTRFEAALDPGMMQRSMFPGKMDPPFRLDDLLMEKGLLSRVEQGERAACKRIDMPQMRATCLEFIPDLRAIFNRLFRT
jgi:hypothetical protein